MQSKYVIGWVILALAAGCKPSKEIKTMGTIERLDPALDQILSADAKPEILGQGYTWSEGPVWDETHKFLLFSDVPQDTVYKWTEDEGVTTYLTPSGYTGSTPSTSKERGANGLLINAKGQLVLCQHGDRRLATMNAPLDQPAAQYTSLAERYHGKRFDSPNDVVADSKGNYYFTDPPYGLADHEKDSAKDAPYQGVYRLSPDGKLNLLVDSLTKPNGIALSPDEKYLFVANSDPERARWYRFEIKDSTLTDAKIFYDATSMTTTDKGLPDGMKIDKAGHVFASGPGGILIFSNDGKLLGKVKLPEATANCALNQDGTTLFITSHQYLLRLKMR